MSTFLSTSIAPRVDLHLLRRDFFDGFGLLLQDENGLPFDLSDVTVCSSVWQVTTSGTLQKLLDVNVEKQDPLRSGRIRVWLTSAQTAALWDAYSSGTTTPSSVFFPSVYADQLKDNNLRWDVRIERNEYVADLTTVSGGTFITQTNHGLASSERVTFSGTTSTGINFNGTAGTIYSGLTNISYTPPYAFRVPSLSGVTSSAIGGSVYRLRQDTVVAGSVVVDTTLSNCFP